MGLGSALRQFISDYAPLSYWLIGFVATGLCVAAYQGFFRARKIQPKGFRWKVFRNEIGFAVINLAIGATVLGYLNTKLQAHGIIRFNSTPASAGVVALEYAAYFLGFDTYFYWFHRLMHLEPMYKWVHKIHHRSTSPTLLTTLSVSPLESLINGGFVPLFTALLTLHQSTMLLIVPTNILMGLYVHSGYEFLPRWWNKTWATKWFISATFHDHHHHYFKWNFGGYTTIWDWICGTVRLNFVQDYEKIKERAGGAALAPAPVATASQGS